MAVGLKNKRKIVLELVIILICLIWLLPVLISFNSAFKSPSEFISGTLFDIPGKISIIDNINYCFRNYGIDKHLVSSLIYALIGTIITILCSSMAGYGIVKLKPKFSFFLFFAIYAGTIFPFQMYLIPLSKMFYATGLYDTRWGMVLVYIALTIPFATFVYRQVFVTIPDEIDEAAQIDGCGPYQAYLKIYMPQLGSATAVVALFQSTWIWNDLIFGMILSRRVEVRPVMVGVMIMSGQAGANIPYLLSAVIVVSIPTILLFLFLRKYFIEGLSMVLAGD